MVLEREVCFVINNKISPGTCTPVIDIMSSGPNPKCSLLNFSPSFLSCFSPWTMIALPFWRLVICLFPTLCTPCISNIPICVLEYLLLQLVARNGPTDFFGFIVDYKSQGNAVVFGTILWGQSGQRPCKKQQGYFFQLGTLIDPNFLGRFLGIISVCLWLMQGWTRFWISYPSESVLNQAKGPTSGGFQKLCLALFSGEDCRCWRRVTTGLSRKWCNKSSHCTIVFSLVSTIVISSTPYSQKRMLPKPSKWKTKGRQKERRKNVWQRWK